MKPASILAKNLAAVPLFLVPLVFTYRATHYYVPKIALVQVSGFLVFALWAYYRRRRETLPLPESALDAPALLFLAWTCLSVLWARNRYLALEEIVFLASLVAVYYYVSKSGPDLKVYAGAVSLASLIASIYGIVQYCGFDFLHPAPREAVSTLGNVNFAGEFTAAAVFATAALFLDSAGRRRRTFFGASAAVQFAYLMLTRARGAWVGAAAGMAVFAVLSSGSIGKPLRLAVYLLSGLAAASVMIAAIAGPETLDLIAAEGYSMINMNHPSIQVRIHMWRSIVRMISVRPLLGTGAGNLVIVYPDFRSLEEIRISGVVTQVARAHNDYLETASDLGLIGLGVFIWLLCSACALSGKTGRRGGFFQIGFISGAASILASSFFGFPLKTPSTALLFWTGLGVIAGMATTRKSEPGARRKSSLLAPASFILLASACVHTGAWLLSDMHLKKAMNHESARNWEMMKRELETSVKYYYPEIQAHTRLAAAYLRTGEMENAYHTLNTLLELNPNHSWAHRALGQIYLELGQTDRGLGHLQRAARLNPVFISYLGETYLAMGDDEKAMYYIDKQVHMGLADEHSYFCLGKIFEERGEKERALRAYLRARRMNPRLRNLSERISTLEEELRARGEF